MICTDYLLFWISRREKFGFCSPISALILTHPIIFFFFIFQSFYSFAFVLKRHPIYYCIVLLYRSYISFCYVPLFVTIGYSTNMNFLPPFSTPRHSFSPTFFFFGYVYALLAINFDWYSAVVLVDWETSLENTLHNSKLAFSWIEEGEVILWISVAFCTFFKKNCRNISIYYPIVYNKHDDNMHHINIRTPTIFIIGITLTLLYI